MNASVPRVVGTVSSAQVTPSSMGEGSPHEGGSPRQVQTKGRPSVVETSGYGGYQGIVVTDPGNAHARGSGVSQASDSHARVHACRIK